MAKQPSTRRQFLRVAAAAPALTGYSAGSAASASAANKNRTRLRIAVIGVGGRGMGVLKASLAIGGIDVAALCDIRREAVNRGADFVQTQLDYKPALFTDGPDDYKRMLQRDDIDAVFVTTPTVFHGPMGAASLRAGKWVFSEVPACNTIEEGWDLINAAEESGKGYFMAENYCFMRHNLLVLNMVEKGVFKTFTFAECGYIHEARDLQFNPDGTLNWRGRLNSSAELIGNTYPTHSLGPVSMWLGITRGDRMLRSTTMMSRSATFRETALKRFGPDSPAGKVTTWNGDTTNSLIQTENGVVISLRFDVQSPRPHHMDFYTLQGTGASYDDEAGIYIDGKSKGWDPISKYYADYEHPYWLRHAEKARTYGHGGGDYFTLQHFYGCIREGKPFGIDVYDAVTWSSLIPLSAKSIREKGMPQEIPDYTRGKWKHRKRFDWSNV